MQRVVDGVSAMLEAEEGLASRAASAVEGARGVVGAAGIEEGFDAWLAGQAEASGPDSKDTDDFKYVSFGELPPFTDRHLSLMRRHLTAEVWGRLKDRRTAGGYSLSNAIQAGVVRPYLGLGMTCGDEESFGAFAELLHGVVRSWHGFDPETQTQRTDLDESKVRVSAAQAERLRSYGALVRVRGSRNVSGFALPAGTGRGDRLGVEGLLREAFGTLGGGLEGTYVGLGSMGRETEEALRAEGLLMRRPDATQLLGAAGAGRDWPEGRGVFYTAGLSVVCWCNEEDHCRIMCKGGGGDFAGALGRFRAVAEAIERAAESKGRRVMYSERLGYLATCPSNLGTGLRVCVTVGLPELSQDPHRLEEVCEAWGLQAQRGSGGAGPGTWDVWNKQRMGATEVELVQRVVDGVSAMLEAEEGISSSSSEETIQDPIPLQAVQWLSF